MKVILIFFSLVFLALGAGVYLYETHIASPKAADSLVKAKKKKPAKKITKSTAVIKKPSLAAVKVKDIIASPEKPSRVVDLIAYEGRGKSATKEQKAKLREIERSIKKSIKRSTSLDIQKAVVTEMSKKR